MASSPQLGWALEGRRELWLTSLNVRRWTDFQLAFFSKEMPNIALKNRKLDVPMPGVASGLLQGRPAFQTCLVPTAAPPATPAITQHYLVSAVNRQPSSIMERIVSLLGFGKPRELRCLLVTLQSTSAAPLSSSSLQEVLLPLQQSVVLSSRQREGLF